MRRSLIVFFLIGLFVLTAATAASAAEQTPPAPPVLSPSSIPLQEARAIIDKLNSLHLSAFAQPSNKTIPAVLTRRRLGR